MDKEHETIHDSLLGQALRIMSKETWAEWAQGRIAQLEAKNAHLMALDNAVHWLHSLRKSPAFRSSGGGRSYGELLDYIYSVFEAAAGHREDE